MRTGRRRRAPRWLAAAALGAAAVAAVVWRAGDATAPRAARETPPVAARPATPSPSAAPAAPPEPDGAEPGGALRESPPFELEQAVAWSLVDMQAIREALPDNLYWQLSMPTDDPQVLREREETRAYWAEQYGKVLSNTGTEQEVRDYYAHRQRLSSDYVDFTGYLLEHYGDVLPERDVGLLALARRLHLAQLEELPRNLARALDRREAHAAAREAWRAQQEQFEGEPPRP